MRLAAAFALCLGLLLAPAGAVRLPNPGTVEECMNAFAGTKPDHDPDIQTIKSVSELCANITYWDFLMRDFQARRAKFELQNADDRILLWMVVAITVSGVLLSGVQLWASYRLAAVAKQQQLSAESTEIVLEAGRISVRSSITGLLILTVSFGFFLVFVSSVYQFRDEPVSYPQQTKLPGVDLGEGALGNPTPPAANAKAH